MRSLTSILCTLLALLLVSSALAEAPAAGAAGETEAPVVDGIPFHPGWDTRDNARVFYEIFVGSFSDSDGDGIGDIRGIINRLDYLNDGDPLSGKSLGVEGLWLTPVFPSPTYHKYDVTDYTAVDPAFGTLEDLEELFRLCHERDMKVILDLPINHTSSDHRWYKNFLNAHLLHNPSNIHYDFYSWLPRDTGTPPAGRRFIKAGQDMLVEANFSDSMPELNFDNESVRQAMLDIARLWLERGADGFRFDAAKYLYLGDHEKNVEFWTWYIGELKKINPEVYTVAEVWDGDGIIDRYASCVNCFRFSTSQAEGLIASTAAGGDVNKYAADLEKRVTSLRQKNPEAMNIPFIANHDTDRAAGYLTMASGRMAMAASLYLLSPGSPFMYYGEEIGLRGSRGGANTDANRRLAMVWGDGDTVRDPVGSTYKKQTPYSAADLEKMPTSLLRFYRKVLLARKANPEIARGDIHALSFPGTDAGGFTAVWQGSAVTVLHNTGPSAQTLDLSPVFPDGIPALDAVLCAVPPEDFGPGAVLDGSLLTIEAQTTVILR